MVGLVSAFGGKGFSVFLFLFGQKLKISFFFKKHFSLGLTLIKGTWLLRIVENFKIYETHAFVRFEFRI